MIGSPGQDPILTSALRIDDRHKRKDLPFRNVAATEETKVFQFFTIPDHRVYTSVLLFLATYWPVGILKGQD